MVRVMVSVSVRFQVMILSWQELGLWSSVRFRLGVMISCR